MNTYNFVKQNFSILVILLLIIIILLQRSCAPEAGTPREIIKIKNRPYEVVKRVTDTVKIKVTQTVYKPGEVIIQKEPIYIPVPANVDTAKILKDYYAIKVYTDTLKLKDSLGYIALTDSITKNSISGRLWSAEINKTLIDRVIYVNKLSNQLYFGGTVSLQQPNNLMIGANAMLKTKKDKLYGIGGGIDSRLNPYVNISVLWKVSGKK